MSSTVVGHVKTCSIVTLGWITSGRLVTANSAFGVFLAVGSVFTWVSYVLSCLRSTLTARQVFCYHDATKIVIYSFHGVILDSICQSIGFDFASSSRPYHQISKWIFEYFGAEQSQISETTYRCRCSTTISLPRPCSEVYEPVRTRNSTVKLDPFRWLSAENAVEDVARTESP